MNEYSQLRSDKRDCFPYEPVYLFWDHLGGSLPIHWLNLGWMRWGQTEDLQVIAYKGSSHSLSQGWLFRLRSNATSHALANKVSLAPSLLFRSQHFQTLVAEKNPSVSKVNKTQMLISILQALWPCPLEYIIWVICCTGKSCFSKCYGGHEHNFKDSGSLQCIW